MKQRLFKLLLAVMALMPMGATRAWAISTNSDGYYEISSADDLVEFAALVNSGTTSANAILTADIDMSEVSNFSPIGYYTSSSDQAGYTGTFDGDGHVISNLTISSSTGYLGLIGYTSTKGIEIKDLGLKDVSITNTSTGAGMVAALVGYATGNVTLTNCYVVGGTITNSMARTGGLVGYTNSAATIKNCYSSASVSGNDYVGGLVGFTSGTATFTNCYVAGGSISAKKYAGGLVGCGNTILTLTNCYNTGTVTASSTSTYAGGLVGYKKASGSGYKLTLTNCYNTGEVTASSGYTDGLVYISGSYYSFTNCFYLESLTSSYGTAKTADEFASGELCYILNGKSYEDINWYQTIGTDSYPVLSGSAVVYPTYSDCINCTYSNDSSKANAPADHSSYTTNGTCTVCGSYQPATLNGDYYEISNPGQLMWFAGLVNGDTTMQGVTAATPSASAKLTANIDMSSISNFTPIGSSSNPYTGTFDGGSYEISNLTISGEQYIGLIAYTGSGAKIKDLGLKDVSISATTTKSYVGGFVGYASSGITLTNCYVAGGSISAKNYAGGLVGYGMGGAITLTNCYVAGGTISASNDTGGLIGCAIAGSSTTTTLKNCYNTGSVSGSQYVGGLVGYGENKLTITNCYNIGEVTASSSTDGLVYIYSSSSYIFTNCYYLEGITSSYGTAVTSEQVTNGALCYLLNGESYEGVNWYQTIGTDTYPVLSGSAVVYPTYTDCTNRTYSNDSSKANAPLDHSLYNSDGTCILCGAYQSATLNGDYYEISNPGQLMWFAGLVNGDTTMQGVTAATPSASAKLTANIDMSSISNFSPIGSSSNAYTGTFDGGSYEISNLTISGEQYIGLIAYSSGATIKNLGLKDVSISATSTNSYAGGFVGYASSGITLTNCYVAGGSISAKNYAGGLVGYGMGGAITLTNCYNIGEVTASSSTDGLVYIYSGSSYTFTNCYYLESLTSSYGTAVTSEQVANGALCYLLNGSSSEDVSWYQNLGEADETAAEEYPVTNKSKIVYPVTCTSNTGDYTNNSSGHKYIDKVCKYCNADDPNAINLATLTEALTISEAGDYLIYGTNENIGSAYINVAVSGVTLTLDNITAKGYNTIGGFIRTSVSSKITDLEIVLVGENNFEGVYSEATSSYKNYSAFYSAFNYATATTVTGDGTLNIEMTENYGHGFIVYHSATDSESKLTFSNTGTINIHTTGNYGYGLYVATSGHPAAIYINSGTMNITTEGKSAYGVYVYYVTASYASLYVNGGTLNINTSGDNAHGINLYSNSAYATLNEGATINIKTTGDGAYGIYGPTKSSYYVKVLTTDISITTTNGTNMYGTITYGDNVSASDITTEIDFNDNASSISFTSDTTVDLATYTRVITSEYTTLALPFDCVLPETDDFTFYAVTTEDAISTTGEETRIIFDELSAGDTLDHAYGYLLRVNNWDSITSENGDEESDEDTTPSATLVLEQANATIYSTSSVTAAENNLVPVWKTTTLPGTGETMTVNGEDVSGSAIYKLARTANDDGAYDYFFNHSAGSATVAPFRAYLYVPTDSSGNAPKRLTISFGDDDSDALDTTALNPDLLIAPSSDLKIYNLAGQKVETTQKGLYIINGKKVVK